MKELIFNPENLKDNEIETVVTRVKAIIHNSKNEILLGYCDGVYQFPGGHVEDGEAFDVAVNREVEEETGIKLGLEKVEPFYRICHYKKNYENTGMNTLSQIYYFYIKTDEEIKIENIKYTEREKRGGFRLEYIEMNEIPEKLKENIPNNKRNATIVNEMLTVLEQIKLM